MLKRKKSEIHTIFSLYFKNFEKHVFNGRFLIADDVKVVIGGGRRLGCMGMFCSQDVEQQGRERLSFQSLLLIRATRLPLSLLLDRLNEMRDDH